MPFATVNGLPFHVQRLGRSHAGDDVPPPVVMLHGLFTGSVASWFFTSAPALAKHRPVVLYDLRGHGRSERPPTGYGSTVQAGDLEALTADLPPFAVVAHSFGALVAMRFALFHPDRVTALALVEPPIAADGEPAWWTLRGSGPAGDPKVFDPERWLAATEGQPQTGDDQQPAAVVRSMSSRQRLLDNVTDLAQNTSVLADLRDETPITDDELVALPAPLLAVFGRRSPAARAAERVRRVRPDADVAVLDAGHAVHVDATKELTALLEKCVGDDRGVERAPRPAPAPSHRAPETFDNDNGDDDGGEGGEVAYG